MGCVSQGLNPSANTQHQQRRKELISLIEQLALLFLGCGEAEHHGRWAWQGRAKLLKSQRPESRAQIRERGQRKKDTGRGILLVPSLHILTLFVLLKLTELVTRACGTSLTTHPSTRTQVYASKHKTNNPLPHPTKNS